MKSDPTFDINFDGIPGPTHNYAGLARGNLAAEKNAQLIANPANFISQPMVDLSVCPTLTPGGVAPRHVDLRPYAVTGKDTWVLPGGLTRVALKEGSIIVNSSQGGGTKDTWILEEDVDEEEAP